MKKQTKRSKKLSYCVPNTPKTAASQQPAAPCRQRRHRTRIARNLLALPPSALLLLSPLAAGAQTWTGGGIDANWSTAGNWAGGIVADSVSANALLTGDSAATLLILDRDVRLSSLVFQAGTNGVAKAFTVTDVDALGGHHDNAIYIGTGGITNQTNLTQTINGVVALDADTTFSSTVAGGLLSFLGTESNQYNEIRLNGRNLTVGGAGNTSIASPIIRTGNLTKTGTGTLTLSGANTYTGTTTVSGGTLLVNNNAALGSGTGAITLSGGYFGSADLISRNFLIVGTGNGFTDASIAGNLSGSGSLVKTGGGRLSLSGTNNTYSGHLTIDQGDVEFLSGASAGTAIITNNYHLAFYKTSTAGGAHITNHRAVSFAGNSTAGNATIINNLTLEFFDLSSAGNATITNNSLLRFRDFSTAGSASITNNGNLSFELDSVSNARIINGVSGTISVNTSSLSIGSLTGSGGTVNLGSLGARTLTLGNLNRNDLFGGVITGADDNLVKIGTGTLTLTGANTYTGTTTVNNGTLQVGDATHPLAALGTGAVTNNSTLNFRGATVARAGTITNAGTASPAILSFRDTSSAGAATITNNASGSLSFQESATAGNAAITNRGIVYFFNASSAGGATITNDLALRFNDTSTAAGATILNNVASAAGYWSLDISGHTGAGGLSVGSLSGAGTVYLGARTLTVGALNRNDTISGVIQDDGLGGSLVKTGTGTLTLSNYNTYTGMTVVNGGTLILNAAPNDGANYGATLSGASQGLRINAGGTVQARQEFQIPLNVPVTLADRAGANVARLNLAGGMRHLLHTLNLGDGAAVSGVNFAGGQSGDPFLILNSVTNNADGGPATVTMASTPSPSGTSAAISVPIGIQGAVAFNVGSGATLEVSGAMSDWYSNGTLTKTGAGTLAVSGASTYTGATTVSGGKLAVNGSLLGTGNVALANTSVLAGAGSVGNIVAASGSVIAPGNSIGTLTATSLLLQSGSMMDFEIGANGASDLMVIRGDGAAGTLDFSFSGAGDFFFRLGDGSGSSLSAEQVVGQSYKLVRLSGNSSTNFASYAPQIRTVAGSGVSAIGGTYSIRSDAEGDYLAFSATSFQPVPAPPAAVSLLIGGGVGVLGTFLRRSRVGRKRKNGVAAGFEK